MSSYAIGVVGVGGVGKTSLCRQFSRGYVPERYSLTEAETYTIGVKINDEEYKIDYVNISLYNTMFNIEGFIVVYSILHSQPKINELIHTLFRVADREVPIVICGNKCDIADQRCYLTSSGEHIASKWNAPFAETSALSNINVDKMFVHIAQLVHRTKPSKRRAEEIL